MATPDPPSGRPQTLPHTRGSAALDALVRAVGHAISWVWAALLLTIVANVSMRYVLRWGLVEFEEQ